jgi:nuclear pore complex protein Nup98-Nup96
VDRFTVGREGIGEVTWHGATDLFAADGALDLDSIVDITPGEVAVYHRPETRAAKPPRGVGLNRPATVTLRGVHPRPDEDPAAFRRRLQTSRGAAFETYDESRGVWTFSVRHWSRYGLSLSDSEDESDEDDEDANDAGDDGGGAAAGAGARADDDVMRVPGEGANEGVRLDLDRGRGVAPLRATPSKPAFAAAQARDLFADVAPMATAAAAAATTRASFPSYFDGVGTGPALAPGAALPPPASAPSPSPAPLAPAPSSASTRFAPGKRREPPAATAYAIAASAIASARRATLPERPRATELATDAHSFLGASFRPSWGPGGCLAHAARRAAAEAAAKGGFAAAAADAAARRSPHAPSAVVVVERFAPSPGGGDAAAKRLALEVALARCVPVAGPASGPSPAPSTPGRESESSDACGPRLTFRCSRLELPDLCRAHLEAVERAVASSCATPPRELAAEVAAWDILSALFGDEPGGAPRGSAADRHRRRAKTRAWLRDQAGRIGVPEETLRGGRAATTLAAAGSAVKATASAAANRDPRLATLLAQTGMGGAGAALAAAQLQLWRGTPTEKYVPEETLAAFGLMAGEVAPPHPLVPAEDWRRCLGLHLGVAHPPTASAARVVEGYLEAVEKGAAAFPTAPGREAADPEVSRLKDLCFNLLVLASSGGAPEGVSTASAFHPLTYCASDVANVALTWHVHAALRAVGALPATKETSAFADTLHVAFAEQLLRAGGGGRGVGGGGGGGDACMVEWAAFVAMHVEDDAARRDAVRGILHRRCADWCDDVEKTAFLRRRLGVPGAWLDEAERHWFESNFWVAE